MASATTIDNPSSRRDFLFLATGAVGAVGVAAVAWPLLDQMSPDASTLAMSSIEVDLGAIPEGQIVTVKWRGGPVFVRHRTKKEIEDAQNVNLSELRDPQTDAQPFRNLNGSSSWAFARISDACLSGASESTRAGFAPVTGRCTTPRAAFDRDPRPSISRCRNTNF